MTIARKTVMISSTARDLPEHRKEVMDACLRQGMFPIMMEYLPANDDDAISASLKMVDEADIYVGIFAQRYGYIPKGKKRNPKQISITEMEYDHAVKRKIPCLLFVMDKSHPITIDDIDMENAAKLKKFKDRIQTKTVVNFFKSSADLRSLVINSLSKYLESTPVKIPDKESSTIDVTAYFNALRKRYNVLALEGLTPPQKEEYLQIQLRSVFVEQSVREDTPPVELPKEVWEKLSREQEIHDEDLPSGITLDDVRKARDSYYQKPSRLVLDALTDSRCQYTIILGDPGSGKSTLARYVMLSLIDPLLVGHKIQKTFEGYLPLLIELRTFAGLCAEGKCETPLEFLEHLGKTEGWGLTQTALHNHLKNDGRAVVIFDGLDEIFEPKMREMITNQIVGFTNMYPKARVIVTSRILGYRRKILSDAGFTHFTLQDLDEKQVETFITKWYQLAMSERLDEAKERSERILKSFADSASIRQLAGNPMLLTIMAIIGKHQELPRERWKLYDHAASVLIQHWDVNKHLKDENLEADFIGEDDKKELLRRLAYRMQNGDGKFGGNYIDREGLQEEFETYLRERYSQTPDRAKIIAEAMIQQFRERNFILSLYGANVFGFVHRAFLEYFCASAFVRKFEKTKELTIEQLKTDVYGKYWSYQSWHEVLRLISGMIDEKWAEKIIDYVMSMEIKATSNAVFEFGTWTWRTRLLTNLKLVSDCLSEIQNLNSLLAIIKRLVEKKHPTATYTLSILKNRLSELSEGFELILNLASNSSSEDLRGSCLHHLSEHYNDNPKTLLLLHEHAAHDSAEKVRRVAVWALAQYYREDAQTLSFLEECIAHESDPVTQRVIEDAFKVFYRKDTQTQILLPKQEWELVPKRAKTQKYIFTENILFDKSDREEAIIESLPLLRERVVQGDDANVRRAALLDLAKHYHRDVQVLPLLWEWAVKSEYADVRNAAMVALAEYFRENAETLLLLQARAIQDVEANVRRKALEILITYYNLDTQILQFLRERIEQDIDFNVRRGAVAALAKHCHKDFQVLSLLRKYALESDYPDVRMTSVFSMAKYCHEDAEVLSFLRELVSNSINIDVRSAAVSALAVHYREDARTLPLLQEWAVKSEHSDVRSAAIWSMAQNYNEGAMTLQFLWSAIHDNESRVRNAAVLALAERYRENTQTLLLLHKCAVNDESPKIDEQREYDWQKFVRETSLKLITKYWADHPDTLPLLRERAENDPTPWLRERCKELIEEIEGKKV